MILTALGTTVGSGVPAFAGPAGTAVAMGAIVVGIVAVGALVIWWRAS